MVKKKTEELSTKSSSIGSVEHKKEFWTLLLKFETWGTAMKLWEASLSSSALADTEPNKIRSNSDLWAEGDKTSEAEI